MTAEQIESARARRVAVTWKSADGDKPVRIVASGTARAFVVTLDAAGKLAMVKFEELEEAEVPD